MSRTVTFLLHCIDDSMELPEHDDTTMSFVSITNEIVFNSLYSKLGTRFSGIAVADSHAENVIKVLKEAYRQRVHYFKSVVNGGQVVYLRREKPFVILPEYCWGLDLNEMKKCIQKRTGGNKAKEMDVDVYFDENYKSITGILCDIACWMGQPNTDYLRTIDVTDLSVYIARWGGIPGQERFKTPYGL